MAEKHSLMDEKGEEVGKEKKEELDMRVQELKRSKAALLAEIDLFKQFISRNDPQDLMAHGGRNSPGARRGSRLEGGGHGWRWKSHCYLPDHLQLLTLEQKLSVAQREVIETQQDREKLKQSCEKIQDNYKVCMKEAEMHLSEIRKAQNEFERRLPKLLKDNSLNRFEPEKVLQYIQDKTQITQLEEYHLKNQALRAKERKLLQQLQQRREAGKAEYEIVFQEFNEPRVDKNLNELQVNHLKVHRVLSSYKVTLQSVTQESTELSDDITNRKQVLAKIEEEIQHAQEACLKAEAWNQHLRRQTSDYQAPDIMEYAHIKHKHKRLQRSIHTWERKVRTAEMAMKVHSKALNTQRDTFTPANSADAGAGSERHRIPVKLPHIAGHRT